VIAKPTLCEEFTGPTRRHRRPDRFGHTVAIMSLPLALLLQPVFTSRAAASWSGGPNANLPVETAANAQDTPAATPDGTGGAIIVWEDYRNGTGWDVYAQHVLACGNLDPTWPPDGVLVATVGSTFLFGGLFPGIVTDGSGGAFVLWNGAPSGGFAQHVLSTGVTDPSWPAGGLMVGPFGAAGTSDGVHGIFIAWQDASLGPANRRVFVQHLLSTGVDPAWPASGVRACPGSEFDQFGPTICRDGAGGAIVSWGDRRTAALTNRDIFAQRISASGSLLWSGSGMPVVTAVGQQLLNGFVSTAGLGVTGNSWSDIQSCAMVPDGASGCFVTWCDGRTVGSTSGDVYAQHLTASGSVASGWDANGTLLCMDSGGQFAPTILSDGAGGAIATWVDSRASVFAQHVTASGIIDGPSGGLALSTAAGSSTPSEVSDGSGGAIITWADFRVTYSYPFADELGDGIQPVGHIYSQHVRIAPTFSVDPAWPLNGLAVSTAPGGQDIVTLNPNGGAVSDGSGGVIAYWTDYRGSNSSDADYRTTNSNIYAQRVLASGVLPSDPVAAITGPASGSVYAVNTAVTFTGSFSDPDGGTHTAQWTFDGGSPVPGIVNESLGTVSASHVFTSAGVYMVNLVVTDECGGSSTATQVGGFDAMVVIYDPSAGFVTGGGWINSPAGAYATDPGLVGKANFGFESKYAKGATIPTGDTEFQFKVGNMNFHSTSYDWLVIAGARAQYKGLGTINGSGTYRFMLTAIDGQVSGGGGADKIRMKIWDSGSGAIVYDNQPLASDDSDPVTTLGGGSVVIHKDGGQAAADGPTVEAAPVRFALVGNAPNPFNPETAIAYDVPRESPVRIRVFDLAGRVVATLIEGVVSPGHHTATWNGRTGSGSAVASGKYFVRMEAGSYRASRAIMLLK